MRGGRAGVGRNQGPAGALMRLTGLLSLPHLSLTHLIYLLGRAARWGRLASEVDAPTLRYKDTPMSKSNAGNRWNAHTIRGEADQG